jgi:hypothetical protein
MIVSRAQVLGAVASITIRMHPTQWVPPELALALRQLDMALRSKWTGCWPVNGHETVELESLWHVEGLIMEAFQSCSAITRWGRYKPRKGVMIFVRVGQPMPESIDLDRLARAAAAQIVAECNLDANHGI